MAWTKTADGTQTATVSTEHTLQDVTTPGGKTYILHVDVNAMADDDVLELRVYQKVLSTGTLRVAWLQILADAQGSDNAVFITIPFVGTNNIKFTLKQSAGTGRSFPWELYEQ